MPLLNHNILKHVSSCLTADVLSATMVPNQERKAIQAGLAMTSCTSCSVTVISGCCCNLPSQLLRVRNFPCQSGWQWNGVHQRIPASRWESAPTLHVRGHPHASALCLRWNIPLIIGFLKFCAAHCFRTIHSYRVLLMCLALKRMLKDWRWSQRWHLLLLLAPLASSSLTQSVRKTEKSYLKYLLLSCQYSPDARQAGRKAWSMPRHCTMKRR